MCSSGPRARQLDRAASVLKRYPEVQVTYINKDQLDDLDLWRQIGLGAVLRYARVVCLGQNESVCLTTY